ncbi:unnamed protein product [Camellia sinensis]
MRTNKIDKNAIKFKTKPLEHMELMRRVYEGAMETEKYTWTPGAAFEPVATEDNPLLKQTSMTVRATSSAIHIDDTPMSGRSKCKVCRTTHEQRKKDQSEGASKLASSMENLAFSVKLQQREVRVHHDYRNSTQELVGKCLTRLYSLQGLDPQDLLIVFFMALMDNPANQAILLQIPMDEAVISWLRMKKSQNIGSPSTPTHGSGMGGWF